MKAKFGCKGGRLVKFSEEAKRLIQRSSVSGEEDQRLYSLGERGDPDAEAYINKKYGPVIKREIPEEISEFIFDVLRNVVTTKTFNILDKNIKETVPLGYGGLYESGCEGEDCYEEIAKHFKPGAPGFDEEEFQQSLYGDYYDVLLKDYRNMYVMLKKNLDALSGSIDDVFSFFKKAWPNFLKNISVASKKITNHDLVEDKDNEVFQEFLKRMNSLKGQLKGA